MENYLDVKLPFAMVKNHIFDDYVYFGTEAARSKPNKRLIETWVACRDVFHANSYRIKRFLFHYRKSASNENIAAFINEVENKLKIKPRTVFYSTHIENVIWVMPSKWWTHLSMRRSLFTILLRSGQRYNRFEKNFNEAIYSEIYLKTTKFAIDRFLKGHTNYRGNIVGWYNQFYYGGNSGKKPSNYKVRKLLVKP